MFLCFPCLMMLLIKLIGGHFAGIKGKHASHLHLPIYGHVHLHVISCSANHLSPSYSPPNFFFHRLPHEGGRLNIHSMVGGGAEGSMFTFLPSTLPCSVVGVGSLTFTHCGYSVGHMFHFQFVIYTTGGGPDPLR